ncbi:hypothetical protein ABH916_003436 [Peribacillus frigoritolerans]
MIQWLGNLKTQGIQRYHFIKEVISNNNVFTQLLYTIMYTFFYLLYLKYVVVMLFLIFIIILIILLFRFILTFLNSSI